MSAPPTRRTPRTANTSSKCIRAACQRRDSARAPGMQIDMSEETSGQQTSEQNDDAHDKAQQAEEKHERARQKMEEIEKDPPDKLEDWPDDEAKYETFGGSEDSSEYDERHEEALGEHSVRHHEDGKVEVKGEEADNPDDYK